MEGRPLEDADLVEQARRGDADAYAEIVRRYQDLAFRTAYLVTGLPSDAENAAQEAFVKAYQALPTFRSGAPLRPWLLRIVANEARNRRRSSGRRTELVLRVNRRTCLGRRGPVGRGSRPQYVELGEPVSLERLEGAPSKDAALAIAESMD